MRGLQAAALILVTLTTAPATRQPPPTPATQETARPAATLARPADALYPTGSLVIAYTLERASDRVDIDILDAKGAVMAGWTGWVGNPPTDPAGRLKIPGALTLAGTHSLTWDLHASGYLAATDPGWPMRPQAGPLVPPGRYVVQLTAHGKVYRQGFRIVADPPIDGKAREVLQARFDLAMAVRAQAITATAAINRAWAIRQPLERLVKTASDHERASAGLDLLRRVDAVVGSRQEGWPASMGLVPIHEALASLGREVAEGPGPTADQRMRLEALSAAMVSQASAAATLGDIAYAWFKQAPPPAPEEAAPPPVVPPGPPRAPGDKVYTSNEPGLTMPRALHQQKPRYTARMMQAKIQGVVMLSVIVEPDGTVRDVTVRRGLHPDLDAEAIRAAREWRFSPGVKDGKAVPVRVGLEMAFSLRRP